jgi:signal transduction histidine kinase
MRERADGAFSRFGLDSLPQLEPLVRSLATELGQVREQERKKIADHLHDQIGQNLVLAKIRLNVLKSEATGKQRDSIGAISDLMDQTIRDTRSLIQELHVEWLAELDPTEALHCLVEQLQTKYSLRCATSVISLPKSLEKDVQEVLLQAVRELLVNVAKHAGVDAVKITCESEKGWIRIRVVDDGRGFEVSSAPARSAKGGFGLMIVRARLGQLGGNLHIESRVGMGTRATVILPCA